MGRIIIITAHLLLIISFLITDDIAEANGE